MTEGSDRPRLIEHAFCLRQASIDSVARRTSGTPWWRDQVEGAYHSGRRIGDIKPLLGTGPAPGLPPRRPERNPGQAPATRWTTARQATP